MVMEIPVHCVDRGKVDANNVLGVILSFTDDGFYKIRTKNRILSSQKLDFNSRNH
jgi:hypothetical protein